MPDHVRRSFDGRRAFVFTILSYANPIPIEPTPILVAA